jgi:hypothetical protein
LRTNKIPAVTGESSSVRFSQTVTLRKFYNASSLPPGEYTNPPDKQPEGIVNPFDCPATEHVLPSLEIPEETEDNVTLRSIQRNQNRYSATCNANESFVKSKSTVPTLPEIIEIPSLLMLPFPSNQLRTQEHVSLESDALLQPGSFFLAPAVFQPGAIFPSAEAYVSNRTIDYMPPPLLAPSTPVTVPKYFLESARKIVASQEKTPSPSPFRYDGLDPASAEHNASIIRPYLPNRLRELFESLQGTVAGAGSEFRSTTKLETLLNRHPHWPLLSDFLIDGVQMLSTCDLTADPIRASENRAMIERGNHKSCENNPDVVRDQIAKDCKYGFVLPLPLDFHQEILNSMVGAISLVCQSTTTDTGERIPKYRFAHDQTFTVLEEAFSANDIAATNYQPAHVFGYLIPRFVNYILAVRR